MFFLKDKYVIGYRYGDPTFYGTRHLGIDYICPTGTKVFAPFNGTVTKTIYGIQGGYTTWFKPDGQNITYRFLHLSMQLVLAGSHVMEGDLIALSGNTGTETTTAHVHFDCFTGNILPPLIFTNFINPVTITFMGMVQNVLALTWKVPDIPFMQSWVKYAQDWLKGVTNGAFEIAVEYKDVSTVNWRVLTGPNTQGQIVNYIDPDQVLDVAAPFQTGKYSIATLIAYYDLIVPRPTYDEAPFLIKYGMAGSQKGALNPGGELIVNASFLMHEWLHNWYFILQSQGIPVVDDVHQHSTLLTDPNPLANFSDIVLKLKPYWPLLTKKGDVMLLYKFDDNQTVYALSDDATLIGITAAGLPKTLKGRPQKLVVLPASQRSLFVIADSAIT